MSLARTVVRFASSRQGRKLVRKAKTYAQSPQGRERIDKVARAVKEVAGSGGTRARKPGRRRAP